MAAERVVKRVYSAKALVDNLEVALPSRDAMPDSELAQATVRTLEAQSIVPADAVRVTVRDGHLLLEGLVNWYYQSRAPEKAVRHLREVRAVRNHIRVRETGSPENVRERIEAALRRSAGTNRGITVESLNGMVILRGSVRSLPEREEAEHAAWRAPGVTEVENRLTVAP